MKNNIGRLSLTCSTGGLIVLQAGIRLHIIGGWGGQVLLAGFTAATVGGIADWFAVRALFHRIPIPFISRHTNILSSNRERLTESMVELITTRWLSPELLKEKIAHFSLSARLSNLSTAWPGQLFEDLDLAKPLGGWLHRMIAEDKHRELLQAVYGLLLTALKHPQTRAQLSKLVEQRAMEYSQENWFKRLLISFADQGSIVDKLLLTAQDFIEAARNETDHPINREIEHKLISFADRLCYGPPLAPGWRNLLTDADPAGWLKENPAFARSLDEQIRKAMLWLLDKHYHQFGQLIRNNLQKLSDATLTGQIQEKVGSDLQYIRLNGAIVGGIAGMLIYLLQCLI